MRADIIPHYPSIAYTSTYSSPKANSSNTTAGAGAKARANAKTKKNCERMLKKKFMDKMYTTHMYIYIAYIYNIVQENEEKK